MNAFWVLLGIMVGVCVGLTVAGVVLYIDHLSSRIEPGRGRRVRPVPVPAHHLLPVFWRTVVVRQAGRHVAREHHRPEATMSVAELLGKE